MILTTQGNFSEHTIDAEPRPKSTPPPPPPSDKAYGKPILWKSPNPYKQSYEDVKVVDVEPDEERKIRLKELWRQAQKQSRDPSEQLELQKEAIHKLRKVRRKVDQVLVKAKFEPAFPIHKTEYKDEEQFLIDSTFDLDRMNKFMELPANKVIETLEDKYEYEEVARIARPTIIDENSVPIGYDKNYSAKDKKVDYDHESSEGEKEFDVDTNWFEADLEDEIDETDPLAGFEGKVRDELEEKSAKKKVGKLEKALSKMVSKDK